MPDPVRKPAPEALSLQQAAIVLQVSDRTLRRWWKARLIVLVRVGPKLLRMPKSEVLRLRQQRDEVPAMLTPGEAALARVAAERLSSGPIRALIKAASCDPAIDPQDVDRLAALLVH